MQVIILGANGMLGHKLLYHFAQHTDYNVTGTVRKKYINFPKSYNGLDFAIEHNVNCKDNKKIKELVNKADIVINAIGLIKQIKNVSFEEFRKINGFFPHKLAHMCRNQQKRLIHISTDCVFSGKKGNYSEIDLPDPIDTYGLSKAVGEIRYGNTLTIRTSIIGTELESSFGLLEWLRNTSKNKVDGYRKVLWSGLTTERLAIIIEKIVSTLPDLKGLYNIGLKHPIDKYSLLHLIKERFGLSLDIEKNNSVAIDRSLNSELFFNTTKFPRTPISQQINEIYDLSDLIL